MIEHVILQFYQNLKGKFTQKNMLISDVRSNKIGKNAGNRFSISRPVLKIYAFKVEKLVT